MTNTAHGLMAEFETPGELVSAVKAVRAQGYKKMDAYSPFAIEELIDAMHLHKNRLPLIVLTGGIIGGIVGYLLQYYVTVWDFPINIGGRPLHSWPSYIVITFEMTILFAALSAVLGFMGLCGLPMPYHPVFNVPGFGAASRNRFFLCIEASDPLYDPEKTTQFLQTLQPKEVSEVAN